LLAPNYQSATPNQTVNLSPGSSLGVLLGLGGNALSLTGGGSTVNNAGTIDPSLLGLLSVLSGGVAIDNPANATRGVTLNNLATGTIKGTSGLLGANLLSGMAVNINNTATGTTTVVQNDGVISSTPLLNLSLLTGEAPVMVLHGGAQAVVNNSVTGVINGRVAMQGSNPGNRMTNAGVINGSVSMGTSAGGNTFTALTGSSVNGSGGAEVSLLGLVNINAAFAQIGVVDGGGGSSDTLVLQSGTSGVTSGTASSSTYINFENLRINSGNWTLQGQLANGGTTSIGGGTIVLNSADNFGAGPLTITGGVLQAGVSGLSLSNTINLGGTLGISGTNALNLAGTVTGTGGIAKTGSGSLTLSGTNSYTGTTALNGGSLLLANAQALGASTLRVDGASSLESTSASVANNVILNAALTLPGADALGLNGVISGTGALLKTGTGTLTLNGSNSYSGNTVVSTGNLVVGNDNALGTGALSLTGNAGLSAGAPFITLGNAIGINGNALTVAGSNTLNLNGVISGAGRVIKDGVGTLSLGGANAFADLTLNSGTLNLVNSGALGSGTLTVNGASSLTGSVPLVLANAVQLNAALSASGSNPLTLNGIVSGATGSLIKNGGTTLALNGANTFGGGVTLNAGALQLGNAAALGTGALRVNGSSTLSATQALALSNDLSLASGAILSLPSTQALTLGGAITGQGGIATSGPSTLTLNGLNTYSGGTTLAGGSLVVGNSNAIGSGTLGVTGASTLSGSQAVSLTNDVNLASLLTIGGASPVSLAGVVRGDGSLQTTAGTSLTLRGANTYAGGTVLNGGTLTVGNDSALGAGNLIVSAASQLSSTGIHALSNDVQLGANLSVAGTDALSLNGVVIGAGSISKTDTGTLALNGANTFAGGVELNGGTLLLGNQSALGAGALSVGANTNVSLDGISPLTIANQINLAGNLNVLGSNDLTLAGDVAGAGSLIKRGNSLLTLSGQNTLIGGLDLEAGIVRAGSQSLNGDVRNRATLVLDQFANGTYSNVISGIGNVVKDGAGSLLLTGVNTFSGGLNVLNGALQVSGGSALNDALDVSLADSASARLEVLASEAIGSLCGGGLVGGNVQIASGAALTLGANGSNSVFGGALLGDGSLIKTGIGNLTLSGNSALGGGLALQGGTLTVNGALGGDVSIGSGTSLNGTGNLAGTVNVGAGGTLSAVTGQTLSLGGLNLQAGSNLDVTLGTPTVASPLLNVAGDVVLDGTLNVADAGGFGPGTYQIIRYGGTASGALALGDLPLGFGLGNALVQTQLQGQINLVVQGDSTLQFWNGNQLQADGSIGGGNGVWLANSTNWTDPTALQTQGWGSGFAVFGGAAGTVSVQGGHSITGMQLANGYSLVAGDANALLNLSGTGSNVLRVDPGATADIGVSIVGAGALEKRDSGTLILSSAGNGYTGGTVLSEGVLQVSSDQQLGAQAGAITFNGGVLRIAGNAYTGTARAIDLTARGGTFDIADSANVFSLAQAITGAGGLTKDGLGTLQLTGANQYAGGTQLNAGRLLVGGASAIGAGALAVNGDGQLAADGSATLSNDVKIAANTGLTVDGAGTLSLSGIISGATGQLIKDGTGTLSLSGNNSYGGGTTLTAGTLEVLNDSAVGTGVLRANGNAVLANTDGVRLTNSVELGGQLGLAGQGNLTLAGLISGTGTLVKNGPALLIIERANTYSGLTQLQGGTLQVNDDRALGDSALSVTGSATLAADTARNLANAVALGDGTVLAINNSERLALDGVINGNGELNVSGAGTLALNGVNTYTGPTRLTSGILELGNNSALGTSNLVVQGASQLTSTAALSLANNITLASQLTLPGTFDTELAGSIAGNGTLVKSGASTLGLAGDNSGFAGELVLQSGQLSVANNAALGTALLNVTGDSLLANTAPVNLANTIALVGDLTLTGAQDLVLSGAIGGDGRLIKRGAANLALNGPNTHAQTELQAGGLTVDVAEALGDSLLVSGIGRLNTTTDALNVTQDIGLDGDLILSQGANLTLSGVISGGGDLEKSGTHNLTLSGANSYSGNTRLRDGTLTVTSDTALGTSRLLAEAGTLTTVGTRTLDNRIRIDTGLGVLVGDGDTFTLLGEVAGDGALSKTGNGVLVLGGNNRYFGDTTLGAGTLSLASDSALGAGSLVVTADSTLAHDAARTVSNDIVLNSGLLTLAGNTDLLLNGNISGAGGLVKSGADGLLVLAGTNSHTGGTRLANGGSLLIGNNSALGTGALVLAADSTLDTTQAVSLANTIDSTGTLTLPGSFDLTLAGSLIGSGNVVKQGGSVLTLTGDNAGYTGTFDLAGGTLVGNSASLQSNVIGASGTSLTFDQAVEGTYGGVLSGAGDFTKSGAGLLTLSQAQAFTGALNVLDGTLATAGDNFLGSAAGVNLTAGTLRLAGAESLSAIQGFGNLELGQASSLTLDTTTDQLFAGAFLGTGTLVKQGAGQLTLSGSSSHTGIFDIDAGTLRVDGSLASTQVNVGSAATLTGNGTLGGDVVVDGTLIGSQNNNIFALGSLTLDPGATFQANIGSPIAGATLINVGRDLQLGGTLEVIDTGGLGLGVYQLFQYGGALGGGFNTPIVFAGNSEVTVADLGIQHDVANKALNLLVGGERIRYWGGETGPGGIPVGGGSGTWSSNQSNWLLGQDLNSIVGFQPNNFAVFTGTVEGEGPYVVSIADQQSVSGLQFLSDGYVLSSDGTNAGITIGNQTPVRVNAGASVTIEAPISGGSLEKLDGGELILGGTNSYTGGTTFTGGTVQVSSEANLGNVAGGLTFNGGSLQIAGTDYDTTSRDISLVGTGGTLDIIEENAVFTVDRQITGSQGAALTKAGVGTLVLSTANAYDGGTTLQAGTLLVGNDRSLGQGDLSVTGVGAAIGSSAPTGQPVVLANNVSIATSLTVVGPQDLSLAGNLSGNGGLTKDGSGQLTLSGKNSYGGGTSLLGGTLSLTNSQAIGNGDLLAGDATTLDAEQALTLANAIQLNGAVTLTGEDLTLSGVISDGDRSGSLIKTDNSVLTLAGANTYSGGTQLNAGTLVVVGDNAVGSGTLSTGSGTTVRSLGAIRLNNLMAINGQLTLDVAEALVLNNAISGNGSLVKVGSGSLTLAGDNAYTGGTQLQAGTLVVGSDTALGNATGALDVTADSTLQAQTGAAGAVQIANAVNLGDGTTTPILTLSGDQDLILNGLVGGAGSLFLTGNNTVTLNGPNTYLGGTTLNDGALVIGNSGALGAGSLLISGASALDSAPGVTLGQAIQLDAELAIGGSNDLVLAGDITGRGSLIKNGLGDLTLSGSNTYAGGTQVNAGTLTGNTTSLQGDIATAAGAAVRFDEIAAGTYQGLLSGGGSLVKTGLGELTLTGSNTYTGGTQVQAGALIGNAASLQGNIDVSTGASLVFNQDATGIYAGGLSGAGNLIKNGAGNLSLNGDSSGFTGVTNINNGILELNGQLGSSAVNIGSGASLTGGGTVSGAVNLQDGSVLVAGTYLTPLTFQSLSLNAQSVLDFQLGVPDAPVTLVAVNGQLNLGGTLNITDAGGFGTGVYRLFSYGARSGELAFGTLPTGYDLSQLRLQNRVVGTGGVINLVVQTEPGELQYWNGANTEPGGLGGDGVWSANNSNWNDIDFQANETWRGGYAVFDGAAGTVTVEGQQAVTGMQFIADGYQLVAGSGGGIITQGSATGGATPFITDPGTTATLGLDISGAGGVDKQGTGTLVLAGNNSYTGGTTVRAGTLQVSADAGLGQADQSVTLDGGALAIAGTDYVTTTRAITLGANGGALDVQSVDNSFLYANAISGSGRLEKRGAGLLELTGTNTYTGGTLISQGTLRGNSNSLVGAIDTQAGTTLEFAQSTDGQFGGVMGGAGSLVKSGAGSLTLSGANSYSGGTLINGGSLIGTSTSLQGAIEGASGTQLVFDQSTSGVFGGAYSGAGALVKLGSGSLTLQGGNSYTGGTQVIGGSLIGNSTSLVGQINNDATLIFDQDQDGVFTGDLLGTGTLVKQGSGALVIDAEQGFTGNTIIRNGSLLVGAGSSGARLFSTFVVETGGQLQGSGSVGSVDNAGALTSDFGAQLFVDGDYTQRASGWTRIGLTSDGPGFIRVARFASLAGNLEVFSAGGYSGEGNYNILTAEQVEGTYDEVVLPDLPLLDIAVAYTPTSVNLDISRNETAYIELAVTPNQQAVAGALAELPSGNLVNAVTGLGADELPAAYDSLSGEVHASTASAMIGEANLIGSTVNDRMRQACSSGSNQNARLLLAPNGLAEYRNEPCTESISAWGLNIGQPGQQDYKNDAWGQTIAGRGKLKGNSNTSSLERSSAGMMIGFDRKWDEEWRVGVAAGYLESTVKASDRRSESDVTSYVMSAYASRHDGNFNTRLGISHSLHEIESKRDISIANFSQRAKADYDARTTQLFGELSYVFDLESIALEPFAALSHSRYRSDRATEKGGDASLSTKNKHNVTQSTTGLRAAKRLDLNDDIDMVVRGSLGWQHTFGSNEAEGRMRFVQGGDSFKVDGSPMSKDAAVVGAGVDMAVSERSRLAANYQGQFSSEARDHSVSLTFSYSF
jgi:autotransporter-associated beta strand protein